MVSVPLVVNGKGLTIGVMAVEGARCIGANF